MNMSLKNTMHKSIASTDTLVSNTEINLRIYARRILQITTGSIVNLYTNAHTKYHLKYLTPMVSSTIYSNINSSESTLLRAP